VPISDKKIRFKRLFDLLSNRRFLWIIILVAIAVRLLYALVFLGIDFPYIDTINTDSYYYHKMGIIIASSPQDYLSALHPPLYPLLLSLLFRLAGDGYIQMVCTHILLDISALLLVWGLLRRLQNSASASSGALIYALYPEFIFMSGHMISEALYIPLLTLSLYLLVRLQEKGELRIAVFAGLALALSALTRANIAAFPLFLLPWALIALKVKRNLKKRFYSWLIISACFIALLVPWTVRNYFVFHSFVPISTSGAEALYGGNHPGANGGFEIKYNEISYLLENPRMEIENQHRNLDLALNWISEHPSEFFSLIPLKLYRFFTFESVVAQKENYWLYFWVGAFTYLPLSALAVLGLFFSFKNWRRYLLFYLLVIYYVITTMVFFGDLRLRTPLIPIYIILGCLAVSKLLRWQTEDKEIWEGQRAVIQTRTN
jgi:4-amino-4-deoxy-L-arabinose transferase-like glycosyltransferase